MDTLIQKQLISSRSLQYNYYTSPNLNDSTADPVLVLFHGFPDSASVWAPVVTLLVAVGFRLMIPDLLGYAGTSKPWNVSFFNSSAMANDIIEILDQEGVANFVSVGHDWGAFMAHRMYLWHPERVNALVVGAYNYEHVARTPININMEAEKFERQLGWPVKYYYKFLASSDAPSLLSGHPESFYAAGHGENNAMNETFGRRDGLVDWLSADKRRKLQSYANDPAAMSAARDNFQAAGFTSPLMWYRALVENVHMEVEKNLAADADNIRVPFLHMGGSRDPVCPPAIFDSLELRAYFSDFTSEVFECGHFLPSEKPKEIAETMIEWLKSRGIAPQ
ncbi:putative epoxide hydrolase [Colletotrichum chrysophilum]|uniref:Epoxide hydrolase n=1 Tax=Colletotrichum chrysophilum TaxID=1836956 RepID=A0AAD9AZE2_9PEZI|nr:putative epoxide hydrolase [Colletotrichum chrysophilum]